MSMSLELTIEWKKLTLSLHVSNKMEQCLHALYKLILLDVYDDRKY